MPGRRTLTATSRPSVVTARWTWAIEAAPTGVSSNWLNRLSSGASSACLHCLADQRKGRGRERVLEREEVVRSLFTHEVGPGGEGLTELDRGRAELLERGRIVGLGRLAQAEAGELDDAAGERRGEGIALDPLQRPVARKGSAPA